MARRAAFVLICLCFYLPAQEGSKSVRPIIVPRKVALVIGNSQYRHLASVPPAGHDADDMAATLSKIGFDLVHVRKDLTNEQLIQEFSLFRRTQVRPGDLVFFYYSGHGGQVGEENYLLPVDYDPPSEDELVELRAYRMSRIRDAIEGTGARVRVLVFDACRSNSLVVRAKDPSAGLRQMEAKPEGTLIAYASAHNQVARYAGSERNSFYTAELLAALRDGSGDLKQMLEHVQRRVHDRTGQRQTPYLYGFLSAPLYLKGGRQPAPVVPAGDAAREAWELARSTDNKAMLEAIIREFPHSEYARLARVKLAGMDGPVSQPVAAKAKSKVNTMDGLTYVWIPPGTFTMGCSPGDRQCYGDEKPAREVTITKGFWMGETEVTQSAYEHVLKTNPSHFKGADRPVEGVMREEAEAYCRAIRMRLPTDAEWEYSARAGTVGVRYGDLREIAWFNQNETHRVRRRTPNDFELYDMFGNVWEWVTDLRGQRVARGGSWANDQQHLRASARFVFNAASQMNHVGFRCVGE